MANYCISFSPTGGTRKVADILKTGIGGAWTDVDLVPGCVEMTLDREDLCIVAVPSFGGRVPDIAAVRLKGITANRTNAIAVCVYGNRAYEDTLVELQDILEGCGFVCVGAVAALAEHSIMRQFAAGRPDDDDRRELLHFGEALAAKCGSDDAPITLPGNRPYKAYKVAAMQPAADERCVSCGACVERCPVGAIDPGNPGRTDPEKCISCMACTAACPVGARYVAPAKIAALTERLRPMLGGRKENELFI